MINCGGIAYFNEKEISNYCGLSKHWFRKARYSHKGPKYYKLDGKIFYTKNDVDEWIKSRLINEP